MRRLFIALAASVALAVGAAALSPEPHAVRRDRHGAVVGIDTDSRVIHLIFTADSMFEGGPHILDVLADRGVKASFFFTGNFLRDSIHDRIVRRTIADGHYVGPHSNRHILLADWDDNRTPFVTADSAVDDMEDNYAELKRFGITSAEARYIVPPYEWYNRIHVEAYRHAGMTAVSPSPGIQTYRDYTTPDMADYHTSDSMWRQLMERERTHGLNGAIIIVHPGTQDIRTDKFYYRLGDIIDTLRVRGYRFARIDR